MTEEIGTGITSALLADHVAAAARALEASGGVAVCSFTKAGIAVPGLKYAEGRWASLHEVLRASRSTGSVPQAIDDTRHLWRAALERALAAGFGPDWIAYRSGGVDSLDELTSAVAAATRPVAP